MSTLMWTKGLLLLVDCTAFAPMLGALIATLVEQSWVLDALEALGMSEEAENPDFTPPGWPPVPAWADLGPRALWVVSVALAALLAIAAIPSAPGAWILVLANAVALVGLAMVSGSDVSRRLVPDVIIVPMIVGALVFNAFAHTVPWMSLRSSLLSAVGTYAALEIASMIGGLAGAPPGGGDSKLMAFVAAWMGWGPALLVLFLGTSVALIHSALRRAHRRRSGMDPARPGFPLAPYVALAFFVVQYLLVAVFPLLGSRLA